MMFYRFYRKESKKAIVTCTSRILEHLLDGARDLLSSKSASIPTLAPRQSDPARPPQSNAAPSCCHTSTITLHAVV